MKSIYDEEGKKLNEKEAAEKLEHFWKKVYQKHENKIADAWDTETRLGYCNNYDRKMHSTSTDQNQNLNVPNELREHMDAFYKITKEIQQMSD